MKPICDNIKHNINIFNTMERSNVVLRPRLLNKNQLSYKKWKEHYNEHLSNMYSIMCDYIYLNKLNIYDLSNFDDFCTYVYKNSSKRKTSYI